MVCSTVNVAEDTSLVSSLDNDTPSQAESQDPLVDSFSGQTSQQDPQEVLSSGEMSNGSVPYSRKSMWNGGHGPPYQDSHNGNAGPLLHQHPHLVMPCLLLSLTMIQILYYILRCQRTLETYSSTSR